VMVKSEMVQINNANEIMKLNPKIKDKF
jgi:hypothetical protein